MHLLPSEWNVLPQSILDAYQKSEFCIFEDNPLSPTTPFPPMKNKDGVFYPWAQSLVKTNEISNQLGLQQEYGIDTQLLKKAIADKKNVCFLDEENACIAFAKAPKSEQDLMLDIALNRPDEIQSLLSGIYSSWREWDIFSFAKILEKQVGMFPELYNSLITERNIAWSPKIIGTIVNNAAAIIAVGALHFLGVNGICHQIENHGYHLENLYPYNIQK